MHSGGKIKLKIKAEEMLYAERRRWLLISLVAGSLISVLIGSAEYYLWKDYLDIRVGITLGIMFSFSNLLFSYVGIKTEKIHYFLVAIIPLLLTAFFAKASFEYKSTGIGEVTGIIVAIVLLLVPILAGVVIAGMEPLKVNKIKPSVK